MSKKFTIIVPCYNAENYIERCISSALDQDYENCEVIVVDNDSADDSLEIVEELYEIKDNSMPVVTITIVVCILKNFYFTTFLNNINSNYYSNH